MPLCRGGTDLAIWAGVRSGQSHCRVWIFLGWQLLCPAFVQAVACRQSLPLFPPPTPPQKSHASLRLPLQPLPGPAANSCRRRDAGVVGSTCCRCSCRRTLISGGCVCVWKDIASNIRCAKPAAGSDGEAPEGLEVQDPWDAERMAAAKPMAAGSQLVPAGLPGRRLSLAGPELCGEAGLGKPSAPRAHRPPCQQSWDGGRVGEFLPLPG